MATSSNQQLSEMEQFWRASKCGRFEDIAELLNEQPHYILECDSEGLSLLHWSVHHCDLIFMKTLLEKSAKIDQRNAKGQSALHLATLKGLVPCLKLLLSAGADISLKDYKGNTCLLLSVQNEELPATLFLLKYGADVNDRDINGCSCVHWAAQNGSKNLLNILHYCDADLEALDDMHATPLHRAIANRQVGTALWLVRHGADPYSQNQEGKSAIDIARDKRIKNVLVSAYNSLQFSLKWNSISSKTNQYTAVSSLEDGSPITSATSDNLYYQIRANNIQISPNTSTYIKGYRVENLVSLMTDFSEPAFLKIGPFFWILSLLLVLILYISHRAESWDLYPGLSFLWEIFAIFTFFLYLRLIISDPGEVKPPTKGNTAIEVNN
eukprot:GHVL01017797.1.p1 GENE.GHVL01017797.1~~GHVL01017797.1.p1  ORF type:complete len:382 (+),score=53.30 GHVL01017797.1:82-1227(+)